MSSQEMGARDSSPDFAELRARASRRRTVLLASAAGIAVVGAGVAAISAQRSAQRDLEAAVTGLRACLLAGPLDAQETAGLRFRRLQLRAQSRSDAERSAGAAKLWPFVCRDAAGHAADVLKESASDADRASLSALVTLLSDGSAVSKESSAVVLAAVATLDKAFAAPIPKAAEPLPPLAANVDTLSKTVGLSKKGLSRTFTEDNPGLALPVLIDEEALPAPLLCQFRADAKDAECRALKELSSVHGHGLRLLGTSDLDAPNLVFAGKRGREGVFVAGSLKPIDSMYSYGGYSKNDGSAAVLGWDEDAKTLVLTRKAKDQAPVRTKLKPNFRVGNYFYGSQLLWDQVLVRGITPNDERRLFVLPLGSSNKDAFELVDIGELPEPGLIRPGEEEQPHVTGCRTDKATVIRVRGDNNDYLTFRINGKFSEPVKASPYGVLGCYGTTATTVFVAQGRSTRIQHDTCTSAGCVRSVISSEALEGQSSQLSPRDGVDVAAVDLEGKVLAVWSAGETGGLRLRMAEPEQFAHAPDKVVFDDHVADGKTCRDSTLLGFRLYSREHFAVLLLSTMAGVHALRIDPDGTFAPWTLKLE